MMILERWGWKGFCTFGQSTIRHPGYRSRKALDNFLHMPWRQLFSGALPNFSAGFRQLHIWATRGILRQIGFLAKSVSEPCISTNLPHTLLPQPGPCHQPLCSPGGTLCRHPRQSFRLARLDLLVFLFVVSPGSNARITRPEDQVEFQQIVYHWSGDITLLGAVLALQYLSKI